MARRLAEAEETAQVWSSVAGGASWASPTAYFERLIADVRWRMLVTEAVASERRWSDLRDGVFQDAWDRMLAWWDKVMRAAGPAVARATTLAAAGAGSLVLALKVAPLVSAPLDLPIRPRVEGVDVQFSPQMKAIPLQLSGPDGLTVPVSFETKGEAPLRVSATLDEKDRRTLAGVAGAAGTGMGETSRQLRALVNQVTNANEQIAESRYQLAEGLGALTESASALQGTIQSGVSVADTMKTSAADLHSVAQVGLRPPLVTTVAWAEGATRPVELVWVDSTGRIVDCVIDLTARSVSSSVVVGLEAPSGCSRPLPESLVIAKGIPAAIPEWPFKFALERVERPLFGTRWAYLRITRTEGFERDQRRTAQPPSASRATGR